MELFSFLFSVCRAESFALSKIAQGSSRRCVLRERMLFRSTEKSSCCQHDTFAGDLFSCKRSRRGCVLVRGFFR